MTSKGAAGYDLPPPPPATIDEGFRHQCKSAVLYINYVTARKLLLVQSS